MKSPAESEPKVPRRKYKRPVVRVYGTIGTLTRNAQTMNPMGDGAGMFAKT